MGFRQGLDRGQTSFLPPTVEEYVPQEASVRFIDAFVERLDFAALGFSRFEAARTGRPAYHPACLTKLFLFGYLNGIRSSRRLEVETHRNLEVIWLMQWLQPDFKTLCDFRRDNSQCFIHLFREFNLLCRDLGLFGAELVAVDGAKFKASNNFRRNMDAQQLQEGIDRIDANIERFLSDVEAADRQEQERRKEAGKPVSAEEASKIIQDRIDALQGQRRAYAQGQAELTRSGERSISLTDPDSKRMRYSRNREGLVGYNVQIAVDAKHGLIAAQGVVTSANDLNELAHMSAAAKEVLRPRESLGDDPDTDGGPNDTDADPTDGVRLDSNGEVAPLKVLADGGYFNADELMACEKLKVETYVSCRKTSSGQSKDGAAIFPKESFLYDESKNAYLCPANQLLTFQGERVHRGDIFYVYRTNACTGCSLKPQCTQAHYRTIHDRDSGPASQRARDRATQKPQMRLTRQGTVEKVFGSMRNWGHDKFLTRGIKNVRAEFSMSSLSYNIKRAIQVLGVPVLIQKMGEIRGA